MTALDIFEEIRFIVELLLAEQIFTWSFAKRKPHFLLKSGIGYVVLVLVGTSYAWIKSTVVEQVESELFINVMSISWYIGLAVLSLFYLKCCYEITLSDVLFLVVAGYSVQHIEYVVVNEVIARGVWQSLTDNLWLYAIICVLTCILWYWFISFLFAKKLKACGGILYEDSISSVCYFLLLLVVLFSASFMCQYIFLNGTQDYSNVTYQGAISDFFTCSLILVVQYSIFRISTLNREKEIVGELLYERQKQYKLSKENIEMINHKCHDLKYQIQALKHADSEEIEKYIAEVEDSIMIYDHVVKTDNEVLNTILSEKSLYCEKHKISLSCIVDATPLDFMRTLDIYALLGNALDNAIECVSMYKNKEHRVISLTISTQGNFLCIQTNNYLEGQLQMEDGMPVSTKQNRAYHGFGMKSMKHLVEQYGGALYASQEEGVFMLQMVIPIPDKNGQQIVSQKHHFMP